MHTEQVLAALLTASPSFQAVDASSLEVRWPLGLCAVQATQIPRESLFGSRNGWIATADTDSFRLEFDGASLEIEILSRTDYTHDTVHLWLTPTGALATAENGSCTSFWREANLAGTVCLVTDGTVAAVEFELYDGAQAEYGEAYFGRVDLGARGVDLAEAIAGRSSAETGLRFERQRHQPTTVSPELEISGHVDALGRRQGLWIVRDTARSVPELEMNWRDGIPDGVFRRHENEWIKLSIGSFRRGFLHGQAMVWQRFGGRIVEDWVDGLRHGEHVLYHSSGRRIEEFRIEHGIGVGPLRVLSFGGALIDEKPNPYAAFGRGIVPEVRQARLSSFRATLAEFHTRR